MIGRRAQESLPQRLQDRKTSTADGGKGQPRQERRSWKYLGPGTGSGVVDKRREAAEPVHPCSSIKELGSHLQDDREPMM